MIGINVIAVSVSLNSQRLDYAPKFIKNVVSTLIRILSLSMFSLIASSVILLVVGGIILLISRSRQIAISAVRSGFLYWSVCGLASVATSFLVLPVLDSAIFPITRTNDASRFSLYLVLMMLWLIMMTGAALVRAITGYINCYRSSNRRV
jgi:hypothetical protein